jgi:hypothetical protein
MTTSSASGVSRFTVRYQVRRGKDKGKVKLYTYYKARVRTIFLGNYRSRRAARRAVEALKDALPFCVLGAAVAFGAPAARASQSCPSFAEARAAHRGAHLWWHGRAHCWDATAPGQRVPKTAPAEPSSKAAALTPAPLPLPRQADDPPLSSDEDYCCWPPLEPDFADRWLVLMQSLEQWRR